MKEAYFKAYRRALAVIEDFAKDHGQNEIYLRSQLWKDYNRRHLDPDGKALRYVNDVKCTADALLSIQRICQMEKRADAIIPVYRQVRQVPIFYFPAEKGSINVARASVFGDKIDWTLLDLQCYFSADRAKCRLLKSYVRPKTAAWLKSLGSFAAVVDWYGVKGIFTDANYDVYDIENGGLLKEGDVPLDKNWSAAYYEHLKEKITAWNQRNARHLDEYGL